jgi:hypothetical protein
MSKTLPEAITDLRALIEPSAQGPAYMHGLLASKVREDIGAIEQALEVLRAVEWTGHECECPLCDGHYGFKTHAPDCKLAALIGAKVAE